MVGLGLGVYGVYLESLVLFYLLVGMIGASGVRRGLVSQGWHRSPEVLPPKAFHHRRAAVPE